VQRYVSSQFGLHLPVDHLQSTAPSGTREAASRLSHIVVQASRLPGVVSRVGASRLRVLRVE
jgi:hypothetical protein